MTFERKKNTSTTDMENELLFVPEGEAIIKRNVEWCEKQIKNSAISQEAVAAWIEEVTELKNLHFSALTAQEATQGIAVEHRQAKTDFEKNSKDTFQWMIKAIETMQVIHPCAVGAFCRPATFTTTDGMLWVDHDAPVGSQISDKSKEWQIEFFKKYFRTRNELDKTILAGFETGAKVLFVDIKSNSMNELIVMVKFIVHHAFGDDDLIPGGNVIMAMMRVPDEHADTMRRAVTGTARHHEITFLHSV